MNFIGNHLAKRKERLLKNIKHNSSIEKISPVDFTALLELEHGDLSCRTEIVQYQQPYIRDLGCFINDLSFLKYFPNIKYQNLCGQKNITDFPEVEKLLKIEEIYSA